MTVVDPAELPPGQDLGGALEPTAVLLSVRNAPLARGSLVRARIVLMAGLIVPLAGCATVALKHQASVDHGCPEDRIAVHPSPDDSSRPTEVDVCGKLRRYRVMSWDQNFPVWLDVTDLTRQAGASSAAKP